MTTIKRDDIIIKILFFSVVIGLLFKAYSNNLDMLCFFVFSEDATSCQTYVYRLFEKVNHCLLLAPALLLAFFPGKSTKFLKSSLISYLIIYLREPITYILINNQYPKIYDVIFNVIMTIFVIIRYKQKV